MSPQHYTQDYVSAFAPGWAKFLGHLVGKPDVLGLEIGAFEGRSARWFIEHVLTGAHSRLVVLDPFPQPPFAGNVADLGARLDFRRESSQVALRDKAFVPASFDFAYIDGDHRAAAVLEDAVLVFRLLKPNGVLIWDDYPWRNPTAPQDPLQGPGPAIDAVLGVYTGRYRLLDKAWQVIIRKLAD